MVERRLSGLPYYGGKSYNANQQTGPWIASLLPSDLDVLYCEPFAGMLGVLLQRPKAKMELVNDINHRIVNWWRIIRGQPDSFAHLLDTTPMSRVEYQYAVENMDNNALSDLERARLFHIVLQQGIAQGDGKQGMGGWRVGYKTQGSSSVGRWQGQRVHALSRRLRSVQLECRDALEVLERTTTLERAVIYCDPPYRDADASPYAFKNIDREELARLLMEQKGMVAISGYGDEWEHLGWHRHEKSTMRHTMRYLESVATQRTEVLWTNYQPAQQLLL